ncbi:type II toxin-antitoxin system VapC family toxin [Phenylobacterium sp.]|uniref:type II toxin-antitoxin system VapC family toxin n=1 Tax=Phenylobacterium sp. TaxID=1871053 RepID=UPI00301D7BEF
MIAIDTNVVVRFLIRDDEAQWARAHALVRDNEVFVASTVVLEAAWVLRSVHRYSREEIVRALEMFSRLPRVRVQEPERVAAALRMAGEGADLADALHLTAAEGCEAFVTFDRRFARLVAGVQPPVRPL